MGEAGGEPPVYVVGTEVPVPGGAHEDLGELELTRPADAADTLAVHEERSTASACMPRGAA